jgi:hypothetical protein
MSQKENNADFSTHVHSDNELPHQDTSDAHSGNAPKRPSSRLRSGLAAFNDRGDFSIPQVRTPGSFSTPTIPSPQPPQSLPLPRSHPARQISGNHIVASPASNAANAPRVRFADEKDLLGVTGRREVGRVVDNEWKKGRMMRSAQGSYENDSSG